MRVVRGRRDTLAADRDARVDGCSRSPPTASQPSASGRHTGRSPSVVGTPVSRDTISLAGPHAGSGFHPESAMSGRAVAYDGETTLAFARAEPLADDRTGTTERYERVTVDLERALDTLGLEPTRGEPDDSFCPGTHSLSVVDANTGGRQRRKVVGIAQRVRRGAALVAGVVLVANREELAGVLEPGLRRAQGCPSSRRR